MKITDEEIQKDLEVCEKADTAKYWNYPEYTEIFFAEARTRWPLYIKELKELREEVKQLRKDICDKAEDTLWISVAETVVDRIDNILGEE